ncbi:MAG: IS110 family transposase, partial [Syntrophomonadaceae bacterium]|nr:IS110 family transposase [Syntrophomonadaceae bacterium]
WAGMAPGNNESAGKRKSGRTRKGNKHLKTALVEAAKSAGRTKNTYLSAQYHRLSARRGSKKATVAVGHTILVIAYHILKERQPYKELGADYFEKRKEQDIVRHAVKRIRSLGYKVSIESPEVPADSA